MQALGAGDDNSSKLIGRLPARDASKTGAALINQQLLRDAIQPHVQFSRIYAAYIPTDKKPRGGAH